MSMDMGETIRSLRKAKGLSQEDLARRLGVSFQAVSKWENSVTMPDVALIPAIADYFGVSCDELFGFNAMETEKQVMAVCHRSQDLRHDDPAAAEAVLREGLKRWPGNELILNNLLYTIPGPERREERIGLARTLAEGAVKYLDAKLDAWRILAENYAAMGELGLARDAIEHIPEIYFSVLELKAELLEGDEALQAARQERDNDAYTLVLMLLRLAELYMETDPENARRHLTAARAVLAALEPLAAPEALKEVSGELSERMNALAARLESK